jgi:Na+-transporting NADH:ubiquinone oxidoreductase subunit C
MQHSTGYIVGFAVAICLVCALVVSGAAVSLKDRQERNILLDRQKKVLAVAGLIEDGQDPDAVEIERLFEKNIKPKVVTLDTGEIDPEIVPAEFDQQQAMTDPETSQAAPPNGAKVARVPNDGLVYDVVEDGKLTAMIFPIQGKGLWSTLYGYIALAPDSNTIVGITFYKHGETPGLGGEVDNPGWKAKWPGRKAFDDRWQPKIAVKKGIAGPSETDPYQVDGLSGATITSRGVTELVRFWLGENGFGPYLANYRAQTGIQG